MPRSGADNPILRLVHYWWPLAMGASLAIVVHRATGRPFDAAGMALMLCGVAAVYSLDRVIDTGTDRNPRWVTRLLTLVGLVSSGGCLFLLIRVPPATRWLAIVIAAAALSYPQLKKLPGVKTTLVATVWTWSAIALPFEAGSWTAWRWTLVPVAWPLLLLLAAGCLLCDLKDAQRDRDNTVASLPVLIGGSGTAAVAVGLALVGSVVALLEHRIGLAIGGAGLALVGLRPPIAATDVAGPLLVDAILTLPGALIAAHLV